MTAEEESVVIKRVLDGEANAFEELVLLNQKNVYNLALKMMKNEEDALDISQEVFLKAYSQLAGFRGESRFSVWLYRMTYNLCIDAMRRRPREAVIPLTHTDESGQSSDIEIPDLRNMPEDKALSRESRKIIAESINELAMQHREILVMREITGMSYGHIAETLNISEGTVKSRISRARKTLVSILLEKGTFPQSYRHKEREEVLEHE